jgi:hypothetical protein
MQSWAVCGMRVRVRALLLGYVSAFDFAQTRQTKCGTSENFKCGKVA